MSNLWFYIKRFKGRRENWHIARMHKKTRAIYLISDEDGKPYTSNYYEAQGFVDTRLESNNDLYEYEIVNESDLDYIEQIFKKASYDKFK